MRKLILFLFACALSLQISPAYSDDASTFGSNSAQSFKVLASYPSNLNYKGTPLVKSIFNSYVSGAGQDELTIRQDFADLYLISDVYNFVYPNRLTPVTISSNESQSSLLAKHQLVVTQGQAILSWIQALKCSFNISASGNLILQQPVPIDTTDAIVATNSIFPDLDSLPGQTSASGSGTGNNYSTIEDWFNQPVSFSVDNSVLNDAQANDPGIPDGTLIAKFSRAALNTFLSSPGDTTIQYGVTCSDSVIPSYSFSSSKNLIIHILPIKSSQTITLNLASSIAWDSGIVSLPPNSSAGLPISYSSLTPNTCNTTSSTLLLLRNGSCRIQAAQPGDTDVAPANPVTQDILIVPTISLICSKGSKTVTMTGLQPKCPAGYKIKSQKIVQPRPIAFVAPQNQSDSNQQQSSPQQVAWNPPSGYTNLNNGFAYQYQSVNSCVGTPAISGKGPFSCGGISLYSSASCPRISILSTFFNGNTIKERPITYFSNYQAGNLVNIEIDTTPGNVLSDKGSFRIDSISCG